MEEKVNLPAFDKGWESEEIKEEDMYDMESETDGTDVEPGEIAAPVMPEPAIEVTAEAADSFLEFAKAHPRLNADNIPDEVWKQVAKGDSLEKAYLRYQSQWTGMVMEAMTRRKENIGKTTGSRLSQGEGVKKDAFDLGWDEI